MKLFFAKNTAKGFRSDSDFHFCHNEEMLMFPLLQMASSEDSFCMVGIQSHNTTTHIKVKDIDVDRLTVKEWLADAIEATLNTVVKKNWDFDVDMGHGIIMPFNMNDVFYELIVKANMFKSGQSIVVKGCLPMTEDQYKLL